MKKYFAILLTLALMLTVVGCASGAVAQNNVDNTEVATQATEAQQVTQATQVQQATEIASETVAETSAETKKEIGEDKAKKAALKHAGFDEGEVTRLHVELDYDDGVLRYEVDFHVGNVEYDYDINAYSGDILSYDKDIDD